MNGDTRTICNDQGIVFTSGRLLVKLISKSFLESSDDKILNTAYGYGGRGIIESLHSSTHGRRWEIRERLQLALRAI